MIEVSTSPAPRRQISWWGVVAAVLGCALFAYTIQQTGLAPIREGLGRVGWGFVAILVLSGYRFFVRALAWTLCHEDERPLTISDTFPALVTGDALGNLTPLGLFVSEPAKAAYISERASLLSAFSSITIENLFYTSTVAVVIAAGSIALLLRFDVPNAIRITSLVGLAGMTLVVGVIVWVLGQDQRVLTRVLAHFRRFIPSESESGTGWLSEYLSRLRRFETAVHGFATRHPNRLLPILALEGSYHVAGVAEVYLITSLIASEPLTLLAAFILEAVNRMINVIFKFVPMRLGVDEAGSGLLAEMLGLGTATGVTLAIVRKVRMLVWTGVGVLLLARRTIKPWGRTPRRGVPT